MFNNYESGPPDGPEKDDPRYTFAVDVTGRRTWFKDGQRHRDDDNFGENADGYIDGHFGCHIWYKNGLRHRDNDKPAFRSHPLGDEGWEFQHTDDYHILGLKHRITGPAQVPSRPVSDTTPMFLLPIKKSRASPLTGLPANPEEKPEGHALYGTELLASEFEAIKSYASEASVPLYAAWMIELGITTKENVSRLSEVDGFRFPFPWVRRGLNVTEKDLRQPHVARGMNKYYIPDYEFPNANTEAYTKSITAVILYDEKNSRKG